MPALIFCYRTSRHDEVGVGWGMPGKPRVEVDGGVYHVYNRVASGEHLFGEPEVGCAVVRPGRDAESQSRGSESLGG